jgi:hypothetical protein
MPSARPGQDVVQRGSGGCRALRRTACLYTKLAAMKGGKRLVKRHWLTLPTLRVPRRRAMMGRVFLYRRAVFPRRPSG